MADGTDIVEQITRADLDIERITCQGEDYIWRPAKRARVALAAAREEITRLRAQAPGWRGMEYADIDTTMWIGVNALNVPDISTLHVDEAECQALIWSTVYKDGETFAPRRCTLLIHKAEGGMCSPSGLGSPASDRSAK